MLHEVLDSVLTEAFFGRGDEAADEVLRLVRHVIHILRKLELRLREKNHGRQIFHTGVTGEKKLLFLLEGDGFLGCGKVFHATPLVHLYFAPFRRCFSER